MLWHLLTSVRYFPELSQGLAFAALHNEQPCNKTICDLQCKLELLLLFKQLRHTLSGMYYNNLDHLILKRHFDNGANNLLILGGYLGLEPVERLAKEKIQTTVIYGCMQRAAFNPTLDQSFKRITNSSKFLDVYYKNSYNHSKLYCWLKDKTPVQIIAGSANFSYSGLCNDYQESLFEVQVSDYKKTHDYMLDALSDSTLCTTYTYVGSKKHATIRKRLKLDTIISETPPAASLSLRSGNGDFSDSGINIGQKKLSGSHVNINDCYLPIRSALIDQLPSLFPNNGININSGKGWGKFGKKLTSNAEFLFDDGEVMSISFEQNGPKRGDKHIYKAIRSFPRNAHLGEYLRKRMGIGSGKPFTDIDFKRYGRESIDLTLISEGQYYADFSV